MNNIERRDQQMKSYLFSSTALHIFAITNSCNLNCVYDNHLEASKADPGKRQDRRREIE